jgi:hypothetical protein
VFQEESAVRGATCPVSAELSAFRSGSLPEADEARVADHLLSCPVCRQLLDADPTVTRPLSDTDPDLQLPPAVIGPYRIVRVIGRGGMGTVFEAVHEEMGCRVAVKMLSKSETDPDARSRFRKEWQAVGRLNHPNVVRGLNAGFADGVPYLAMELVDGPDVGKLVREAGRLAPAEAAAVVAQAARGLAHAHAGRVVHRDVKPSNLLLAPDGTVKVLDLGLAQLGGPAGVSSGRLTRHTFLGTADYMAPEQWDNPAAVGPKADVYALGCVFYHLLAGRPPFSGPDHPSPRAKMIAHKAAPAPDPRVADPAVPPGAAAVLGRMLAKNPADRPEAAAVATALAPFAAAARLDRLADAATAADGGGYADGPPTAPATPWPVDPNSKPARPRRTHRWLAAGAAGLLVVGLAVGISQARRGPRAPAVPAGPPATRDAPGTPVVRPPAASARELSRPAVTLGGFALPVVGVALAPDGTAAFTGELDGTVRRWDLATRRAVRLHDPKNPDLLWKLRGLALAPGGAELVAFSSKKATVLDARTGAPKQTVKVLRNIWSAAVSADGRWLALGHDTASGPHNQGSDLAVTLYDVASGVRAAYWTAPVGVRVAVAFGPDGKTVLAVDADGRVAVLDPAKSAVPAAWAAAAPGDRVVGLVPAVDGRVSAVVEREPEDGSGGSATRRLVCRVLDPATGALVGEMAAAEHAGWSATAAGGSSDGRVGVVGTSAGDLLIGGPAVGAPVPRAAHPGRVGCAAVSADGRKVISAGDDERVVKVWDVPLSAAER